MRKYLDSFSSGVEEQFSNKEDYAGLFFEYIFEVAIPKDFSLDINFHGCFWSKSNEPYELAEGEGLRKYMLPYPYKSENKSPYVHKSNSDGFYDGEGRFLHTRIEFTEIEAAKILVKYAYCYWRTNELHQFLDYHYEHFRGTNLKGWLNCVEHLMSISNYFQVFENHIRRLQFQKQVKDWIAAKRIEIEELTEFAAPQPAVINTNSMNLESSHPPETDNFDFERLFLFEYAGLGELHDSKTGLTKVSFNFFSSQFPDPYQQSTRFSPFSLEYDYETEIVWVDGVTIPDGDVVQFYGFTESNINLLEHLVESCNHTLLELTDEHYTFTFLKRAFECFEQNKLNEFLEYHYVRYTATDDVGLCKFLDGVEEMLKRSEIKKYEFNRCRTLWHSGSPTYNLLRFKKQLSDWIAEKRIELKELNKYATPQPQTVGAANIEVEPKKIEPPKPKNQIAFFLILYVLAKEILKDDFEPFEFNNATNANKDRLEQIAKWAMKEFKYECKLGTLKDYLSKSDKNLGVLNDNDYHSNIIEFITYHYPNRSPIVLSELRK